MRKRLFEIIEKSDGYDSKPIGKPDSTHKETSEE